jgi:phage tail-like protein
MKPQPFILLNKRAGWRGALLDSVHLADGGCALQLAPLPGAATPLNGAAGTFGGFTNPIRLAIDRLDRIYILDAADCLIRRFDPCAGSFETLPCVGGKGGAPRQFRNPNGLAISARNDIYIADTGNRRIQIFSIKGLALRAILTTPETLKAWDPRDLAVTRDGRLYVADYLNGLIHVFDAAGCWRKSFDGSGPNTPPIAKPVRIALDAECRIYVIQEGVDSILVLNRHGAYEAAITSPDDLYGRFCPAAVAVDSNGDIHVTDRFQPFLQQFEAGSWRRKCGSQPAAPLSTSSLRDLLFDASGNPVVISGNQVLQMTAAAVFDSDGSFTTDALDSRIYRCPWHRVVMHCLIPAGSQITVETLTAEETMAADEVALLPDSRWTTSATNSATGESDWDCLVQSPPGRYLWLRLAFHGDGHVTPCVDNLKIYFPRASSLQYLPSVYSQDEPSRAFLDQYLSIFDTVFGGIGNRIGRIAHYFDPMAAPVKQKNPGDTDFLTWLAGWLGLTLERHWPVRSRRLLVKNAWKLFKLRGTPAGLRLHLKIYSGVEPQILEHFKLRRWLFLNQTRLGDSSALWGADIVNRLQLDVHAQVGMAQLIDTGDPLHDPFYKDAYQFTVFLPLTGAAAQDPAQAALRKQTVERIIEMSKPAHTQGYLKMTRPLFRIGVQSYVGMDTVVASYPARSVEGQSELGRDSVIGSSPGEAGPPDIRVGATSRLGSAARIN